MKELMEKAHFPADTVSEVLKKENQFKRYGYWNRITDLAGAIMRELPDEKGLAEKLAQTKEWEAELKTHRYTLDLLVLLCCWDILKVRYEEQKLPAALYDDALVDMRCKLLECRDVFGVHGIFVGFWYNRFFDMTRFALGRLQFELETYPYEEEYEENGVCVKKGDTVINIHIPSCGPLTDEAVDESLKRAAKFYKKQFPNGYVVFVMDSWLLDSDLANLLPEGNIKNFVRRFTIVHTTKREKFMDGWRVFGNEWEKEAEYLPRRTKLQKVIADYLLQGGRLGEGYGVMFYKTEKRTVR